VLIKKKIKNKNDLLVIPSLDSVYKNTVDLSRTTSVFETYIKDLQSPLQRNQTESNTASYPTCNPYNWLYKNTEDV
jgi:hypothetical protein